MFEREGRSQFDIRLYGEELEVVNEFKYMAVKVSKDGSGKTEVENRVMLGRKIGYAL